MTIISQLNTVTNTGTRLAPRKYTVAIATRSDMARAARSNSEEPTISERLKALAPKQWITIEDVSPTGSLVARGLARGAQQFYWRYGSKGKREPIGLYNSSAPPKSLQPTEKGYSIEAARGAAKRMAEQHYEARDTGGYEALKQAKEQAKQAAAAAAERASKFTLAALLDDYCDYKLKSGTIDIDDAKSIFQLHVKEAFPETANKPAAACTSDDFVEMMSRLHGAGKRRTSNKLRSYLRAAFSLAIEAKSQAAIPRRLKEYGIRINPVAETLPDQKATNPDKNPLPLEEMRTYWRLIANHPGLEGAVLRVHLLSGAQRISQLVRAKRSEFRDGAMMLWDGKGKPGKPPRQHPIPMTPELAKAIEDCNPKGDYLFSTDGGKTHIANTTLSKWAKEVVGKKIPGFTAKRIRSGVETLFARTTTVNEEARGRLQSHGIGGVQNASYNAWSYVPEKLEALETLYYWLTATPEVELAKLRAAESAARRKHMTSKTSTDSSIVSIKKRSSTQQKN